MEKKISTSLAFGIIGVLTFLLLGGVWFLLRESNTEDDIVFDMPKKNKPIACTEEAKICPDGSAVGRSGPNCEFTPCPEIVGIANKIVITSPKPDYEIANPVTIYGKAVGGWFFEGDFPVEIYDSNNKLLGSKYCSFIPKSEEDTWMTEEFVDFKCEIKFSEPKIYNGYILFKKDNPSDMRELDEEFKLPVRFEKYDYKNIATIEWKIYKNKKLGFELKIPQKETDFDQVYNIIEIENGNILWIVSKDNEFEYSKKNIDQIQSSMPDYEKIKGIPWAILVKDADNENDLNEIIGKIYPNCKSGQKNKSSQEGVYDIYFDNSNRSQNGGKDNGCFVNYTVYIKYSPKFKKVAIWELGQDWDFGCDEAMADSFRFIK